jgi:5-formyltetrahydrofolate cyclo-ligase
MYWKKSFMTDFNDKYHLRRKFLRKRLQISTNEIVSKSKNVCINLLQFIREGNYQDIFLYSPIKNEPELLNLESYHDFICLPVVKGNAEIEFYRWQSQDELKIGYQGILEPNTDLAVKTVPSKSTLVCVPALAISHQGQRLGYGGGYYDNFMKSFPQATYIAIVFSDFIVENIPNDSWDVKVNILCCDCGVRYLK